MKGGIHFADAGQCLVSLMTREILPANSTDLSSTWVVLPTQRLATWLTASMLGGRTARRAILAPRTMTLDQFVDALLTPLGLAPVQQPANCIEPLLSAMLTSGRYRHLDCSHAHELAHLAGSLTDNNISTDQLSASATQIVREEIYRSDEHVCALLERVNSISSALTDLEKTLGAAGYVSPEQYRASLAREISRKAFEENVKFPWDHLVFAGFTSMVPSQVPILQALSSRKDVTVILTRPPQAGNSDDAAAQRSPLARLATALGQSLDTGREKKSMHGGAAIRAIVTPDQTSEVELALDLAMQSASGAPAHRPDVAILLPDERAYEPKFRAAIEARIASGAFPEEQAPNLAAALPVAQTTAGAWALQLLHFLEIPHPLAGALSREHRHTILALLANPLTVLLARKEGNPGIAEAETVEHARALLGLAAAATPDVARLEGTIKQHGHTDPASLALAMQTWDWLRTARSAILAGTPMATLDALASWFTRAVGAASGRPWQFSRFSGLVDRDLRGEDRQLVDALEQCLFEARSVCTIMQAAAGIDVATTIQIALRGIEAATIRQKGEPLLGVQILTLAEARHIPFQTAIVTGCNEGVFPRSLPRDRLLDQYLLRRLGLPVWEDLEAMEDTTFLLLKSRVSQLIMTAAATAGDQPLVPSRYIELAAALEGMAIEHHTPERPVPASSGPVADPAHQFSGRIVDGSISTSVTNGPLSASRLESLITCPFKFALDTQRVSPVENYDETIHLRRGNWLHDCIELAFSADWQGPCPLIFGTDVAAVTSNLVTRLITSSQIDTPPEFRDSDLMAHLRLWSWPRLARFTAQRWLVAPSKRPLLAHSEWEFDLPHAYDGSPEARHALTGPFRGKIDRFENLGAAWLVLDYKTGSLPEPGAVSAGKRPQLPLYAVVASGLAGLPLSSCIAGYWSIVEGTWKLVFAGENAQPLAVSAGLMGRSQKPKPPEVSIGNTAALKTWREETIKTSGIFSPDHSDCGYCIHADICRRDDPAAAGWFGNHSLSKSLARKTKFDQ